jgi:eukaryotic-like serine/threonine-protein kinase
MTPNIAPAVSRRCILLNSVVSHHRVLDSLGSGGDGVVYGAEETGLSRIAALGFLLRQSGANPKARGQLCHANICTVYVAGEEAGEAFIAMELVHGKPLSRSSPDFGPAANPSWRFGNSDDHV